MKRFFKVMSLFLCLTLFMIPIKVSSHTHGGYSHDSSVNLSRPNWMAGLSDDLRINELSIPGTGNSMSYGKYTDFTLTQSMDLETQLNSGIRFLDLTLSHTGDTNLQVYTGLTNLGVTFVDVIKRVVAFLNKNNEEVVLIKVTEKDSESGNFAYAIRRSIEEAGLSDYIFDGSKSKNPTLGEARGKIILLADYDGNKWRAIPYRDNSSIQDSNHLNTNWDLYSKWEKVKQHLTDTNRSKNKNTRYINYLTGSGGAFPYFVASGHSSSGTGADRLLTGLTEPAFKSKYPEFPRVGRLGVLASIAFEGTNVLTLNYILKENLNFVGIVVADFPGEGLIREIIDLNFKENSNNGSNSGSNNSGSSNGSTSTPNTDGWGFTFRNSGGNIINNNNNNNTTNSGNNNGNFGFWWSN